MQLLSKLSPNQNTSIVIGQKFEKQVALQINLQNGVNILGVSICFLPPGYLLSN